jgi:hypothetical protein
MVFWECPWECILIDAAEADTSSTPHTTEVTISTVIEYLKITRRIYRNVLLDLHVTVNFAGKLALKKEKCALAI